MENKPTMLSYIYQEQETLLKALEQYPQNIDAALDKIRIPENGKILVLATGSSINAALSAKYYIESKSGVQIDIEEPYNYLNYCKHRAENQMVLGVSQSGQSTSTIAALRILDESNVKIAVTSIPDSEITEVADSTLDVLSGRERVGYVTVGFSATVLSLMLFGLRLGVKKGQIDEKTEQQELDEFKDIILNIDQTIEKTKKFFEQNKEILQEAKRFMTIAYGSAFGTAKEMETKFSETVRVPTSGIDLEAFMHGPYLEMKADYRLFFLDTPAKAHVREKAELLKKYEEKITSDIFLISVVKEKADNEKELVLKQIEDEEKCPLLLITPIQVLAWYISEAKGNDLRHRIYTDFSQAVKSKTVVQDYV
ncbi:SIS domain-containing protein [Lactovum odontotermitis]